MQRSQLEYRLPTEKEGKTSLPLAKGGLEDPILRDKCTMILTQEAISFTGLYKTAEGAATVEILRRQPRGEDEKAEFSKHERS